MNRRADACAPSNRIPQARGRSPGNSPSSRGFGPVGLPVGATASSVRSRWLAGTSGARAPVQTHSRSARRPRGGLRNLPPRKRQRHRIRKYVPKCFGVTYSLKHIDSIRRSLGFRPQPPPTSMKKPMDGRRRIWRDFSSLSQRKASSVAPDEAHPRVKSS